MMSTMRRSWFLSTLVGRLTTALAAAIILLGIAGGTIYALTVAINAEHQSQGICGFANDIAHTPIVDVTPPVGKTALAFIKDARNSYSTSNCSDIYGPLPSPAPPLVSAYPGIK